MHSHFKCGTFATSGARKEMEDYHFYILRDNWAVFGVFDGHGGEKFAEYVSCAFKEFFLNLADEEIMALTPDTLARFCLDLDHVLHDTATDGTTGIVSLVRKVANVAAPALEVQTMNVGDSRALLWSPSKVLSLSEDHVPIALEEASRIVAAGGTIMRGRVDGTLALSRGFGDYGYKRANILSATGDIVLEGDIESRIAEQVSRKVIAMPDFSIVVLPLADIEQYILVISCDGLYERVGKKTIARQIDCLRVFHEDIAATELAYFAITGGSCDNVSVIVVRFGEKQLPHSSTRNFVAGVEKPLSQSNFPAFYSTMTKSEVSIATALRYRYMELTRLRDLHTKDPRQAPLTLLQTHELNRISPPLNVIPEAWFVDANKELFELFEFSPRPRLRLSEVARDAITILIANTRLLIGRDAGVPTPRILTFNAI